MFVQFSDSTATVIIAVFGCPQNVTEVSNQGTVTATDARLIAYRSTLPPMAQAGLTQAIAQAA